MEKTKVTNFLPQAVHIFPDEGQDQLDGAWGQVDACSFAEMNELDSLQITLMDGEAFYTHKPPTLLSPSMVVIIKYSGGVRPAKVNVYPRLGYAAKPLPASLPATVGTATPDEITLHNIGHTDVIMWAGAELILLCCGDATTLPTASIGICNRDRIYLYTYNGVITESCKYVTYVGADFFLHT